MSNISILIGRFLLGLYFLVPGIAKIMAPADQLAMMEAQNIPLAQPLLWFAGISSIIGGLALMSGRYVRLAAYGFVVYILLVNVMIHPFWVIESEMQNFIKNLGIAAGLLVLAGYANMRWPARAGWWKSDASVTKVHTG